MSTAIAMILSKIVAWGSAFVALVLAAVGIAKYHDKRERALDETRNELAEKQKSAEALGLTIREWEVMDEAERQRRLADAGRSPADKLNDLGRM